MKAKFLVTSIIPLTGGKRVNLVKSAGATDDDFTVPGIPVTVFGDNGFFAVGNAYDVTITPTLDPDAGPETTQQLTENNNLNNNQMSIFTKIAAFFVMLGDKLAELWSQLEPSIKVDVTTILSLTELVLANIGTPATGLLGIAETTIGSFAMGKIKSVLAQAATDLGLIQKVADQTDPAQVLQVILDDIAASSGNAQLDKVENLEKYLVMALNPDEVDRVQAAQLVQYAKSLAPAPTINTATDTQATAGANNAATDSAVSANTGSDTGNSQANSDLGNGGADTNQAVSTTASPQPGDAASTVDNKEVADQSANSADSVV